MALTLFYLVGAKLQKPVRAGIFVENRLNDSQAPFRSGIVRIPGYLPTQTMPLLNGAWKLLFANSLQICRACGAEESRDGRARLWLSSSSIMTSQGGPGLRPKTRELVFDFLLLILNY
jgi:hypothetical protein